MSSTAYVSLGSNLSSPASQIERALVSLSKLALENSLVTSHWYQSKAVGPGDQADYLNGAVSFSTDLSPCELLQALQAIENQQQRIREIRWGARTLDLDLIAFGNETVNSPVLTVPHPRAKDRNFVMFPLYDIAPDLELEGQSVREIIRKHSRDGLLQLSGLHDYSA